MRRAIGTTIIGLLCAAAFPAACLAQTWSQPDPPAAPQQAIKKWVHLDGVADLEHLRDTNFAHYLRARKIIAAADELCKPGPVQPYPTRFVAEHPDCRSMQWLTSNPPKKVLTFNLDDVGYIALISVTLTGAKFVDGPDLASPAPSPPPP